MSNAPHAYCYIVHCYPGPYTSLGQWPSFGSCMTSSENVVSVKRITLTLNSQQQTCLLLNCKICCHFLRRYRTAFHLPLSYKLTMVSSKFIYNFYTSCKTMHIHVTLFTLQHYLYILKWFSQLYNFQLIKKDRLATVKKSVKQSMRRLSVDSCSARAQTWHNPL